MSTTPPKFLFPAGIARRAGVHPAVVARLLAQRAIEPAGFVEYGGRSLPLLLESRVEDVVRRALPTKLCHDEK